MPTETIPNVNEIISDQAIEIYNLEGISPFITHVREIAKNRSTGADDPVKLTFMKDFAPRSLYWVISKNDNLVMNGGIIWDEISKEWSIHT